MDTLYRSWQLSGWLYHDIFVIIVAIIFIVISGILVISLIRRRSTRRLVPYALILLVKTILLAVAEMERDMIVDRTQEGKRYAA